MEPKLTDDKAFSEFEHNCYLKNLRPAIIQFYDRELKAAKRILDMDLVNCTQEDIEKFILKSKELMSATSINTRLRAMRAFYLFFLIVFNSSSI